MRYSIDFLNIDVHKLRLGVGAELQLNENTSNWMAPNQWKLKPKPATKSSKEKKKRQRPKKESEYRYDFDLTY